MVAEAAVDAHRGGELGEDILVVFHLIGVVVDEVAGEADHVGRKIEYALHAELNGLLVGEAPRMDIGNVHDAHSPEGFRQLGE